jgi:D-glycero-D-manno-heptose 1,7-bisphosphate phosphatase
MAKRAVFLDKDGTLVVDIPYNVKPERLQLATGTLEGLKLLHLCGYQLIVVSNQSGIARGYFAEAALEGVEERLRELLDAACIPLAGFYTCPHHPEGVMPGYSIECECRKPAPGMLLQAAGELDINLEHSWCVGDILHDVEAGHRAGCRSILIDNGNETEWDLAPLRIPDFMASDMVEAARIITVRDEMVDMSVDSIAQPEQGDGNEF